MNVCVHEYDLPLVLPLVSMGCRGRRRGAAWAPSASHGMPPHFSRCSNVCNGSPWAPLGSPIGRMGLLWVSMDSHWRRRGAAGAQHERHGPPMECHERPKGAQWAHICDLRARNLYFCRAHVAIVHSATTRRLHLLKTSVSCIRNPYFLQLYVLRARNAYFC